MHKLLRFGLKQPYWSLLFITGVLLELTALVYQYVLDTPPCVLCIHVRIAVLGLIIIASAGMLLGHWHVLNATLHTLVGITSVKLFETSWALLGTERGFIFSSCGFDLGLPDWLKLDQWLPFLFEVQTTCGYTPELVFGITMAEALLAMSTTLLILSIVLAAREFRKSMS